MDGQRLRDLRKNKGYTQKKLSNMLNVDLSTIGKWEIHNVTPASDLLIKLANIFNVSVGYLLGANDPVGVDDKPTEERKSHSAPTDLAEGERALLDLFSRVPEDKQKLVLQMIRAALDSQQ